jgi:hypothetical protein
MARIEKDKPYRELQKVFARHPIGAIESDTFIEILKFYYEAEEAHLAGHMGFELEPEEAIARRAGVSLDEASKLLTTMASKFFVRGVKRPDGVRVFRLPLIWPGLFDLPFAMREKSPDLDRLGDLWERYFSEGFLGEVHSGPVQIARAVPAVEPDKEQVVPYEDALKMVEEASSLAINRCTCRSAARNCDDPLNVCIAFGR